MGRNSGDTFDVDSLESRNWLDGGNNGSKWWLQECSCNQLCDFINYYYYLTKILLIIEWGRQEEELFCGDYIICLFAPRSMSFPIEELCYWGSLVSCQVWAMAGMGRRVEVGRQGEARQHFSGWPDLFQGFSSHQISFLSLVLAFSLVIALASYIILALAGWLLDSRNSTSSCYPLALREIVASCFC